MRRSAKMGLYALVIAGLVGGSVAWASADKTVTVAIDGQPRTVHTMARTVGGALHDAGIAVGAHDVLAPSAGAVVHDQGRVVLLHGRLLHLAVDGKRKDVWTTAATVDEALDQLGYGRGALVGVSRYKRLPLSPTSLSVVTPKRVAVTADHKTHTVDTTDATVADLLASLKIPTGKYDKLSAPRGSMLVANQHITIQRVHYKTVAKDIPTPYDTKSTKDPTSAEGTTVVVVPGKQGVTRQTVQYVYVDGKLAGKRVLVSTVVSAPTDQQQKVGTKKPTAPTDSSTSSSTGSSGGSSGSTGGGDPTPVGDAQAIAQKQVAAHGWGSGEFGCLVNLWNRESGWNTHAANPSGAYGIPQALPGSKMASAGPDWQDNATTQITWGLSYIAGVYGSPCNAWAHSNATGWY